MAISGGNTLYETDRDSVRSQDLSHGPEVKGSGPAPSHLARPSPPVNLDFPAGGLVAWSPRTVARVPSNKGRKKKSTAWGETDRGLMPRKKDTLRSEGSRGERHASS